MLCLPEDNQILRRSKRKMSGRERGRNPQGKLMNEKVKEINM
jgi:hypothetical protein